MCRDGKRQGLLTTTVFPLTIKYTVVASGNPVDGIVGLDGLIVQAYCLNGYSHHPPPQSLAKLSPKSVARGI